ncbi:MAG: hypothetical protein KJ606_14045 [Chloroflexi bacterium]|nr:hypothetical protein [Chloroflexota bacterium]
METKFEMEAVDLSELVVLEDAVAPWCGIVACYCAVGSCGFFWCGNQ